jgi:hypothetical protein
VIYGGQQQSIAKIERALDAGDEEGQEGKEEVCRN